MKLAWLSVAATLFVGAASAFDAGEHALLGNLAMERFGEAQKSQIKNLEADIYFTYGELIAMAGDMYESVEELSLNDPSVLQTYFNNNRKSLIKCINVEIEGIRTSREYQKCEELYMIKKKLSYLTLAHDNYDHFAWHNLKSYLKFHQQALWFATLAHYKCTAAEWQSQQQQCQMQQDKVNQLVDASDYREKMKSKYRKLPKLFPRKRFTKRYFREMEKEKMLELALFTNAFADHYLSDMFSAGHLRIPRSQIDSYVERHQEFANLTAEQKREKGSAISGALTQYLHNLDGVNSGIQVRNSRGDKFVIRSDKQLFSKPNSAELSGQVAQNSNAKMPIEALYLSIKDVFDVFEHGPSVQQGAYSALTLAPMVDFSVEQPLASIVKQHYDKNGSTTKAFLDMSDEMKLVYLGAMTFEDHSYKGFFKDFLLNIDDIMAKFRESIALDIDAAKGLETHVPKPLLDALRQIN
jgi:hypothetical protein